MRSATFHAPMACLLVLLVSVSSTGCRLCCNEGDEDYAAYGGAWQRTRRDSGRVGSIFDPAGAKASALVDRNDPATPDVIDRQRREDEPDSYLLEPDKAPSADDDDQDPTQDADAKAEEEQRRRVDDLRGGTLEDINVQEINVTPGELVPPLLH